MSAGRRVRWRNSGPDVKTLGFGAALLLGGVVGGGLKAFGAEIPALRNVWAQVLFIVAGCAFILISLLERVDTDERIAALRTEALERVGDWTAKIATLKVDGKDWFTPRYSTSPAGSDNGTEDPVAGLADLIARICATRRTLVLGEPGDGKTTVLLAVTRSWQEAARADAQAPVPLYVTLTTFSQEPDDHADPDERFHDWITGEIRASYGIPSRVLDEWLRDGHVALVLDGLDEVAPTLRSRCATGAATFVAGANCRVVLACRRAEHTALRIAQLDRSFDEVVSVMPAPPDALSEYIAHLEPAQLRDALQGIAASTEYSFFASTLGRSMLVDAVASQPSTGLSLLPISEDTVISRFVDSRLTTEFGGTTEQEHVRRYASVLAANMQRHHITVFHPEAMQVSWLRGRGARRVYNGLMRLAALAMLVYLYEALVLAHAPGVHMQVTTARRIFTIMYFSVFGVLLVTLAPHRFLRPARRWRLSFRRWPLVVIGIIGGTVVGGVVIGSVQSALGGVNHPWTFGTYFGMIFGAIIGLMFSIDWRYSENTAADRYGGSDILATSSLWLLAAIGLSVGVALGVGYTAFRLGLVSRDTQVPIAFGIVVGIVVGRGVDVYGHAALRLALRVEDSLPGRFTPLFDHLVRSDIGRRAGSGFYFRHRRIQEYFADDAEFTDEQRPVIASRRSNASWRATLSDSSLRWRKVAARLLLGKNSAAWADIRHEEARRFRAAGKYRDATTADLAAQDARARVFGLADQSVGDSLNNRAIDLRLELLTRPTSSDDGIEAMTGAWEIFCRNSQGGADLRRQLWAALALEQLWSGIGRDDMASRFRLALDDFCSSNPEFPLTALEKAVLFVCGLPRFECSAEEMAALEAAPPLRGTGPICIPNESEGRAYLVKALHAPSVEPGGDKPLWMWEW